MDWLAFMELLPPAAANEEAANGISEREREANRILSSLKDEELLDLIRQYREYYGMNPSKADVPGFQIFKLRFGPWPRMLEKAGVKDVNPQKIRRMEAKKRRKAERKRQPQ